MQRNRVGLIGAMAAGLLSMSGACFAGITSWYETTPTSISTSGVQATYSFGTGTDTLFAEASLGSSGGSFSASSNASATFNYIVTWTPQTPGEVAPKFATMTFTRWGEVYANVSGGCSPTGTASASASSQSTSATSESASLNICCGQSTSQTNGSQVLTQLPGTFPVKAALVQSGSVWTVTISVPAAATDSVSGGSSPGGGSGGTGISQFKQVAIGAAVSNS